MGQPFSAYVALAALAILPGKFPFASKSTNLFAVGVAVASPVAKFPIAIPPVVASPCTANGSNIATISLVSVFNASGPEVPSDAAPSTPMNVRVGL
jgi:hypothetical protein